MTTEDGKNIVGREGLMLCQNIEISVIIRDVRVHSYTVDGISCSPAASRLLRRPAALAGGPFGAFSAIHGFAARHDPSS